MHDVIKVDNLLSRLDIKLLTDKDKFLKDEKERPVENNYIIRDDDVWRIQSHYLGSGINVDDLEKCVDYITKNGNITKTKDYTKYKISSRIKDLKEGKRLYDMNEEISIGDKKLKGQYTEDAHRFWKNSELIIKELEKLL